MTKSESLVFGGGGGVEVFPSFVPESKTDKILQSHIFGGGGAVLPMFFLNPKLTKSQGSHVFRGVGTEVVFWVCETSSESLGRVFLLPVGCDCLYHTGFPPALENLEKCDFFQSGKSWGILKKISKSQGEVRTF